jgi:hypothetical protein
LKQGRISQVLDQPAACLNQPVPGHIAWQHLPQEAHSGTDLEWKSPGLLAERLDVCVNNLFMKQNNTKH